MEEKVFGVQFGCRNCGVEWQEEFREGDRILEKGFFEVWVIDRRCTGNFGCPYCRPIKCPICGSKKDVRVVRRFPLGGRR